MRIGQCLDSYWAQKKLMAPGCEPNFVRKYVFASMCCVAFFVVAPI